VTNPKGYGFTGGHENLDRAMALAHAHCLLYDMLDADSRFDGDTAYASLVSRFVAAVTCSPAVVSM
jgi:hypothetical protein